MFGSTNNKTLFGTTNTTSAFGQPNNPGFGVQTGQSSGPFGTMSSSQPQQQSIFGQTSSQPLFGSTQSSLFGTNANTSSSNTFGTQQTSNAFGGTNSSIFGGTQQNTTLFGGNRFGTNSSTPFGSTSLSQPITQTTGTTIKFVATAGTDTMMKNGSSTNINTRHQCITCMREYESKSLEELRLEDYTAGRKGPQQQNMFGSPSAVSSTNLFGTTAAPQNAFASTANSGLFGQNKSSFGTIATTTTSSTGLFSSFNKPLFGNNNTFPTVQSQAQPTTSMFGAVSASNPTMNQSFFPSSSANTTATVKPLFGNTTTQTQQPIFGQPNTQNTSLGQKSLFGNTTTSVAPFGANTNTLFNSGNSSNLFTSSQPSLFSTGTSATNNQLSKPIFNFSSPSTMPLNQSLGVTGVTSTPSLFGNTSNAFSNTGSMFGTSGTNFNFGQTNPSFQTNTFQPNVGLQQVVNTSPAVGTDQLVTRFQTFPYGDSPQLQIDVTISPNTKVRTKFTTDPKTLNQYKISAKTIENKPQRFVNNSGKMHAMLFDGLEEDNSDEMKTARDIFVPRKNIKKLVFKPKNTSISNLNESQSPSSTFAIKSQEREGIKYNDSIASEMTINEYINNEKRRSNQTHSISKERLTISPSEDREVSSYYSHSNDSQTESLQNETSLSLMTPKCGVILTRTDYYTIPTIEELDAAYDMSSETCIVDSFTVGRSDYGSIFWDGPIDVKAINLDEIVHIRRKEVIVYPDEDVTPAIGEGLNRAAQITLHQVWPIDKTTHEIIKDKDRLRAMKYAEKIENATLKLGANFKEYRPDTGSWVFTVKHFSKYGLTEEDDDEEVVEQSVQEVNQLIPKQVLTAKEIALNKKVISNNEIEKNTGFGQHSDMDEFSVEESAHLLQTKDNTLNFLFEENELEESDNIDAEQSFGYSPKMDSKFDEYDKMRSTLFDDYEEVVIAKKSKNYPIVVSQKEIKNKNKSLNIFFSPITSSNIKPLMPKRRSLIFEPDMFAANNKIICDISSVCISQSPKISFFNGSRKFTYIKNGSVLICELNLINFEDSANERFGEHLKNNSNIIECQTSEVSIPPFIKTREYSRNSRNPLALELLIESLFGNLSEVTLYARRQERIDRIQVWLFSVNKKLSLPKKSVPKILHFLSTNELESAVDEAINTNNPRLASLLSCGNNINKDLMVAQLDSWKRSKADLYIDSQLLKIYILLSGQINWRISNGNDINILEGLYWTQQLALILLFKNTSEVQNNELGVNLLLESISQLIELPDDVEYHLLAGHTPWVAMSYSSNILESWFLHQSLKSYNVINDENDLYSNSDAVHCFIASQIPDIRWSCFVASHVRNDIIRKMIIKQIIEINSLIMEKDIAIEKWLLENILMPNHLIAEAKALRSKAFFDYKNFALNLIECEQWTEAHEVLIEHVLPDMIINEEHQSVSQLISKLSPNSEQISNYSNGAHIYETYLNCLESSNIEEIKAFNVHQLRCNSKRHVLCQSEMARKANIIFSELNGGNFPYNTPIPDDYALLEFKINARNLVQLLC